MLTELGYAPAGTATVLAQDPAPPPGKGPEFGEASPIALVIVLLLAVAMIALIVSMSKRIRRLPASFDPGEQHDAPEPASGSQDAAPPRP